MALPDYFVREAGSEITWKNTGGTYTITLTSLANNAAREGGKGDLTAQWEQDWVVFFESAVGTAATTGNQIELFWGASLSATAGTDNPSNLTGADAGLSNPDELKHQSIFVGGLTLSNARGTNAQKQLFVLRPPTQWGVPLVVNKSGQTLSGTASLHAIRMLPLRYVVQENA